MNNIYLDNGATSFPKAPGVSAAMAEYIDRVGANVGRGGYQSAYSAGERLLDTRQLLCDMLGAKSPKNIIFTSGVTLALNMLLWGILREGDHILTSSMEHNAVMRPLHLLKQQGISHDCVPCDALGRLDPQRLEEMITPKTRAVVMLHASNVCGTLLPLEQVGEICRRHKLWFIVDAAQTAGCFPLSMSALNADAIAMPGHKGLLGPSGIGCFAVGDALASQLRPLIAGGTGSRSDSEETPDFLPDKFEPGTMNLPGVYGLWASLEFIKEKGIDSIREHELAMAKRLIDGVLGIPGLKLIGLPDTNGRSGVVSVDFLGADNAEAAFALESKYNIMTRCGLHCAPTAHKTLGTFPQGTVRLVPGYATTPEEIDVAINALREIALGK